MPKRPHDRSGPPPRGGYRNNFSPAPPTFNSGTGGQGDQAREKKRAPPPLPPFRAGRGSSACGLPRGSACRREVKALFITEYSASSSLALYGSGEPHPTPFSDSLIHS